MANPAPSVAFGTTGMNADGVEGPDHMGKGVLLIRIRSMRPLFGYFPSRHFYWATNTDPYNILLTGILLHFNK